MAEWISVFASVIAAVAAVLAIPAAYAFFAAWLPVSMQIALLWLKRIIFSLAIASPILLLIFYGFLYPCPWYDIYSLQNEAKRLFSAGQYSAASEVGEQLCECGELSDGWNIQAINAYYSDDPKTAINFWRRSIKADPEDSYSKRRNLADAYILTGAYPEAVNVYTDLQQENKVKSQESARSDAIRYGLGRSLVFNERYSEAVTQLTGLSFNDGGSRGQSKVFLAFAQLGMAESEEDTAKKAKQIENAHANICSAIKDEPLWQAWLFDEKTDVANLKALKPLLTPVKNRQC